MRKESTAHNLKVKFSRMVWGIPFNMNLFSVTLKIHLFLDHHEENSPLAKQEEGWGKLILSTHLKNTIAMTKTMLNPFN